MYKKIIVNLLILSLLNFVGCYSFQAVSSTEYNRVEEEEGKPDEIIVTTKNLETYHFLNSEYFIKDDTLQGKAKAILTDIEQPYKGKFVLSDIKYIQFLSSDRDYSVLSVEQYLKAEAENGKPEEIYLTKTDYKRYQFLKSDYYIENDTLYGKGKLLSGNREVLLNKKIALSDIDSYQLERFDWLQTCLLSGGVLIFLGLTFILLIKSSDITGMGGWGR